MPYILIVVFSLGANLSPGVEHIRFGSKEACNNARQGIILEAKVQNPPIVFCTPAW